MPHQTGQGETIHAGLCGPGAERVTPAVEFKARMNLAALLETH